MNQLRSLRAVGYCRVSTDRQENGLEVQEIRIREKAAALGLPVVIIADKQSGAADYVDRLKLQEAIILAEAGDIFIVNAMDRLGRSDSSVPVIRELLRRKGVSLISCAGEGDEDSPEGRFIRTMFGAMATFDRERKKELINLTIQMRKEQGKTVGNTPYGFKREGDYFVPDPIELELSERIKGMKEGRTFNQLVDELNKEGITLRGKELNYKKVYQLFKLNQEV